jgi:hypothetical protein
VFAVVLVIALLLPTHIARAADTNQFNAKDRQVASDWYNQNKNTTTRGFRTQDKLTTDQESRLKTNKTLDRDLQKKAYAAPRDLRRKLAPPPAHHAYQVIGGHLALVDTRDHRVRDVMPFTRN